MENKIRRISCNEQLYLDMQDLMNTFAIQFILEYEGIVDKKKLENAIKYVLSKSNDTNLMLVNNYWNKSMEDIKIKDISIKTDDLFEDDFFKKKIDYKKHSLEVYLLKHLNKKYIVFRLLHSVSDGKGAIAFVDNVFRRLKNESLVQCSNSFNEQDLVKDITVFNKNIKLKPRYKFDGEINNVKYYIPRWNVVSVSGYHSGVIAKIAYVLSKYFENDEINFMIPVDVRRYLDNDKYLGNMTLPIFLNVLKKDTWQEINGKLLYSLKNKEELNKKSLEYFGYSKLSYRMRELILKFIMKYLNSSKLFTNGSIISYLGRINADKYSNDMFRIVDFISLPLQQPSALFSIVVTEVNDKTNIAISSYEEQLDKIIFNEITNNLKESLEYEVYESINSQMNYNIDDCLNDTNMQIINNKMNIAIDDYSKKYTYWDLDKMVNCIMAKLLQNGAKKHDTVVVYMKRSFEFICSVIACMRMCITFIPVDETTNLNRIIDIVKDSKCKLVILNDLDIDYRVEKLKLNTKEDNKEINFTVPTEVHDMKDIAYKIYTSGTTGKPKGIEISYNNLSNYLTWAKKIYEIEENVTMPLFTSLSVDLTITSIFLPLTLGGTIKVFSGQFSSFTLDKILNDKQINIIKATPTHLTLINKNISSNIKKIIVGGENFSSKLAENILNHFENKVIIYNEYGPTETTIGCIYFEYKKNDFINVPIGKCINNTKAYLVNENNNIVTSENQEGEIIIAGSGLSQGLINEKSNSILRIDNELFYKTGDIGFVKDGVLHCIR